MFGMPPSLSEKSYQVIKRIISLCQQNFPDIDVSKDGNAICFKINGQILNRFDFYANSYGAIGSIAILGSDLKDLEQTIVGSKNIFGLQVEDVEVESGLEMYLDVTLVEDTSLRDKSMY